MKINTTSTLQFTFIAASSDAHAMAVAIIRAAADNMNVVATVTAMPLAEGRDPGTRSSNVEVSSAQGDQLEWFWSKVSDALSLVGVEAT